MLLLFLLVFGLFFRSVNITVLNAWSKWPKQLLMGSCDLFFTDADAVQGISSWQNENRACNDSFFMSFKKTNQNDNFIAKETCKPFSVFYKFKIDIKLSECRNSWENLWNVFFPVRVNFKSFSRWVSVLFWLSLWFSSRHAWPGDCNYSILTPTGVWTPYFLLLK